MNLKDYLYLNNISKVEFAKAIGYTRESIFNYLSSRTQCSVKMAKSVSLYTKGEVTEKEMMEFSDEGIKKKRQTEAKRKQKDAVEQIKAHLCKDCKKKLTKLINQHKKE